MKERCGRRASEFEANTPEMEMELTRIELLTPSQMEKEVREQFRRDGVDPEEGFRRINEHVNKTFREFFGPR